MNFRKKCRPQFARIRDLAKLLADRIPAEGQYYHMKHHPAGQAHMAGGPAGTRYVGPREEPDASRPIMVEVPAPELSWMIEEIMWMWTVMGAAQRDSMFAGCSPEKWAEVEDWAQERIEEAFGTG